MQLPMEERHIHPREHIEDSLAVRMGGRAAELLVYGDLSTGASNDLVGNTELARKMVREWGMSDKIGPMAWGSQGQVFLGEDLMHTRDYSEHTSQIIDDEVEISSGPRRSGPSRSWPAPGRARCGGPRPARRGDHRRRDRGTPGRHRLRATGPRARRQDGSPHLRRLPARAHRVRQHRRSSRRSQWSRRPGCRRAGARNGRRLGFRRVRRRRAPRTSTVCRPTTEYPMPAVPSTSHPPANRRRRPRRAMPPRAPSRLTGAAGRALAPGTFRVAGPAGTGPLAQAGSLASSPATADLPVGRQLPVAAGSGRARVARAYVPTVRRVSRCTSGPSPATASIESATA